MGSRGSFLEILPTPTVAIVLPQQDRHFIGKKGEVSCSRLYPSQGFMVATTETITEAGKELVGRTPRS